MNTERTEFVSRASLSGVCAAVPVERAALSKFLLEFGPLRINTAPSSRHWLICELWTVRDGRALVAGLDGGEAAARLAGLSAGLAAYMWGTGLGGVAAMFGARNMATALQQGAERGYTQAAELAERQTRSVARWASLGPYHELMLTVPDVCLGSGSLAHAAVLTMVTDDSIALWIDRAFGYGYGKRRGTLSVTEPAEWSVSVQESDSVRTHLLPSGATADVEKVNAWWRQPLLGGLRDGSWSSSHLERRLDRRQTVCSALSGTVELLGAEFPKSLRGPHSVGAPDDGLAIAFHQVDSRISYPRRIQ